MLKLWPKLQISIKKYICICGIGFWFWSWLQHFSMLFSPGVKQILLFGHIPPGTCKAHWFLALFSLPMIMPMTMDINKNQVGMVYLYPWHFFKHILAYFGSNVGWFTAGKLGGPRAPGTKWRRQSPVRAAWPSSPKPNDGNDHSTSTGLWFQTCSLFWCRIIPFD